MSDAPARGLAQALDAYVAFYETLTPQTLARLPELVADDVHFRDPFNDVRGIDRLRAVLEHMFRVTEDSRFVVTDRAIGSDGAYLRWRYTFRPKGAEGEPWEIHGMSELAFDDRGRVIRHIDHWDAAGQFYERVPLLGTLLRLVRRRAAAHP